MTVKIVLFNGPPCSGKDTLANAVIRKWQGSVKEKFAKPLKDAVRDMYLNGDQKLFDLYDSQEHKNLPKEEFLGKTCRELQIAISETYFKPLHGNKVFGGLLRERIKFNAKTFGINNYAISDSGFRPEAEALVEEFGADAINLVSIYREGTSFAGDSRGYIDLSDLGVKTFGVTNIDGQLNHCLHDVINFIQPLILR